MSTPRALPIWVEDEDGRHHRGSARYDAIVNPPEARLQSLVERAEVAADRAEISKREAEQIASAGTKGAPDDGLPKPGHRPTAGEPARGE